MKGGTAADGASVSDRASYNDATGGNAGQNARAVTISKYRRNGVLFTSLGLLVLILATIWLDRSEHSNLWIVGLFAAISFLQFEYAANVESSFIGETQRLVNQEKSPTRRGDSPEVETAEWINNVIGKLLPIGA